MYEAVNPMMRDSEGVMLDSNPAYQSSVQANRMRKSASMYAVTSLQIGSSTDTETVENLGYAETDFN